MMKWIKPKPQPRKLGSGDNKAKPSDFDEIDLSGEWNFWFRQRPQVQT